MRSFTLPEICHFYDIVTKCNFWGFTSAYHFSNVMKKMCVWLPLENLLLVLSDLPTTHLLISVQAGL